MENWKQKLKNMPPMRLILFGYIILIAIGTLLLSLPFAAREGSTSLLDAFFTATSASCVTGLIRFDTYTHWSYFGQAVLLILIQTGGIGFMTVAVSLVSFTKAKIGLTSRVVMQNSISAPQMGGIVKMTKFILLGTALIEGCGAFLLSFHFIPKFGWLKGIWFSIFHSISAFCNAGFDFMGAIEPFSSLTSELGNVYVNLVIILLIVTGGLGFFVWRDLLEQRFKFANLRLHSKLVILVSFGLIVIGALAFFLLETGNPSFEGMSFSEKILGSFFQSVTARTAGFNTMDLTTLTESGKMLMICLMLVGGSSGSTAGGMKTTTLAVLGISIFSLFKQEKELQVFGRRMEDGIARIAGSIFMMYLFLGISFAMIISKLEQIPMLTAAFETFSAIATVGLTLNLSPTVGIISEILLALLMIFGRVGSLTILLAFSADRHGAVSKMPLERIQLG